MSDDQDFYRAFEDKYRGSRESIKTRLEVYRPFIEPLLKVEPGAVAIDLGCGRGEWLELAGEIGFDVVGVDLDAGMLEAAEKKGLKVELADVIDFLERQPEASAAVVSGFHIAEHLPFRVLQSLVGQAHRVLMPGGLLILETPNPENVTVGASSFYMDPTHERPLPPALLSFLPEYYGFSRTRVLRLQEPEAVREGGPDLRLLDVFEGVSPDYAVVAQKKGNRQATSLLNGAFRQPHGINLAALAVRYEDQGNRAMAKTAGLAQQATEKAGHATAKAEHGIGKAEYAIGKAEHGIGKAEYAIGRAEHAIGKAEQVEARVNEVENMARMAQAELATVYNSRSWRITRPLRWAAFQISLLRELGPLARGKAMFRRILLPVLALLMALISSRPGLRKFCVSTAQKFGLYSRMRSVYHGGGFFRNSGANARAFHDYRSASESLEELTPHARKTYYRLRSAIDRRRKQA